jgi:hypothetical protein
MVVKAADWALSPCWEIDTFHILLHSYGIEDVGAIDENRPAREGCRSYHEREGIRKDGYRGVNFWFIQVPACRMSQTFIRLFNRKPEGVWVRPSAGICLS